MYKEEVEAYIREETTTSEAATSEAATSEVGEEVDLSSTGQPSIAFDVESKGIINLNVQIWKKESTIPSSTRKKNSS
jgi:hypothetical protein